MISQTLQETLRFVTDAQDQLGEKRLPCAKQAKAVPAACAQPKAKTVALCLASSVITK
jgi:hypothetical protein